MNAYFAALIGMVMACVASASWLHNKGIRFSEKKIFKTEEMSLNIQPYRVVMLVASFCGAIAGLLLYGVFVY